MLEWQTPPTKHVPSPYVYFCLFYVSVWFACMCVTCMLRTHQSQKAVRGPLELQLQPVVNCQGVLGIEPRSSGRATSALNF